MHKNGVFGTVTYDIYCSSCYLTLNHILMRDLLQYGQIGYYFS